MNFSFTAEQETLRSEVRRFLSERVDLRAQLAMPAAHDASLWKEIAEAGWLGTAIPEPYGGQGLGRVELAIVLEETGRVLLPGPFGAAINAILAIGEHGTDEQRARWLPAIVSGETIAVYAEHDDAVGAAVADVVVSPRLGIVTDFTTEPVSSIDLTRPEYRVTARAAGEPLGPSSGSTTLVMAAEAVGGAAGALEMAVAYAKQREQFGKPIGALQAIKHKCADMLRAVEAARLAVLYAAATADEGSADATVAAATARALASDAFMLCAADNIQIHGGIGATFEHDAHLYYRRAVGTHGDPDAERDAVARALLGGRAFAERG